MQVGDCVEVMAGKWQGPAEVATVPLGRSQTVLVLIGAASSGYRRLVAVDAKMLRALPPRQGGDVLR